MKKRSLGEKLVASPYVLWAAMFIIVPLIFVAYYSVTDANGNVVLTDWEFSKYYIADRPESITFSVQLPSKARNISVAAEDVWGHLSEPLTAGV